MLLVVSINGKLAIFFLSTILIPETPSFWLISLHPPNAMVVPIRTEPTKDNWIMTRKRFDLRPILELNVNLRNGRVFDDF